MPSANDPTDAEWEGGQEWGRRVKNDAENNYDGAEGEGTRIMLTATLTQKGDTEGEEIGIQGTLLSLMVGVHCRPSLGYTLVCTV